MEDLAAVIIVIVLVLWVIHKFGHIIFVILLAGAGLWGIYLAIESASAARKRREELLEQQEAALRRKTEEETRQQEQHKRNQVLLHGRLTELSSSAKLALQDITDAISSANRALDRAEAEYEDGVFAPFWDAVESALKSLTRYNVNVQTISDSTSKYADASKSLESQPPPFIPNATPIPDATSIAIRLKSIVRKAQKAPDFAKIYEMRRTNSLLVAGFANLGSAIENMSDRINDSVNGLAQTLDSAITTMSQQNAEYYRESLSAIETLRDQLSTDSESIRELISSDSQAQREHEGKMEEMTDNIQRRKRPYIPKFRDGQY